MWVIKGFNDSITSEIPLLSGIGEFASFSDLKVLTREAPISGVSQPPQYLEPMDFSDPYYPKSLTSFEMMQRFGFSTCLKIRRYESAGRICYNGSGTGSD